eukprot:711516-Lingulodinium_polyedra.AAC.1
MACAGGSTADGTDLHCRQEQTRLGWPPLERKRGAANAVWGARDDRRADANAIGHTCKYRNAVQEQPNVGAIG